LINWNAQKTFVEEENSTRCAKLVIFFSVYAFLLFFSSFPFQVWLVFLSLSDAITFCTSFIQHIYFHIFFNTIKHCLLVHYFNLNFYSKFVRWREQIRNSSVLEIFFTIQGSAKISVNVWSVNFWISGIRIGSLSARILMWISVPSQ